MVFKMKSIDTALELLQDSQWHLLDEIGGEISLSENTIEKIATFLEMNGFINLDNDKKRAKIEPLGLRFLELPTE